MLAASLTLTNCTKEIENPVQEPETAGIPFEIVASTTETKTVNEGMSTKWAEGDKINLFHAVTDGAEYFNNGAFTVADVTAGRFTGELVVEGTLGPKKNYDWYALYPYNEDIVTPAPQTAGYTYIGYSKGLNQEGHNSMASLKSTVCPLYAVLEACPAETTPRLQMHHLSSVVAIKVTNKNQESLTVTTASLTAEEDIVGSYYFDLTTTPVTYTKSGDKYVYKTATVNVTSGATALAKEESAVLYLAIKPFTAAIGSKLVLSVNGYEKELTMQSDVTFSAGKIKTLNFSYDKKPDPVVPEPVGAITATLSFANKAQRTDYSTTQQVWEQNGITFTNNKASSTTNIADYAAPVRLYANSEIIVEAPGNITEIVFDCNSSSYATALKNSIGDTATASSDKVTVSLSNASTSFNVTKLTAQVRVDAVTVTYVEADPTAPSITAGNVTDVSARGVEAAELTYEIANLEYSDLTVTCDGTVVTSASKGEDGVINYVVSVNSTTSARDGSITISNGTLVKEVKVSQLAPKFTVSRNDVELGATKDSKTTVTVTSDFDWTLSSEGTGYTVTPDSYTWDEDGKETVAIQATASRTEEGVAELGTITLVNSTTGQKLTIKVTQATSYVSAESETVTMNIYANKGTLNGKSISWTQSAFTVTNNQAKSSNAIRTSDSDHFRLYANSELIFTSASKTFNKVVVTCTSTSYATALKESATNAGLTASASGSVVTISTSTPTTAMPTITMSAQSRIKKVVVELN